MKCVCLCVYIYIYKEKESLPTAVEMYFVTCITSALKMPLGQSLNILFLKEQASMCPIFSTRSKWFPFRGSLVSSVNNYNYVPSMSFHYWPYFQMCAYFYSFASKQLLQTKLHF